MALSPRVFGAPDSAQRGRSGVESTAQTAVVGGHAGARRRALWALHQPLQVAGDN